MSGSEIYDNDGKGRLCVLGKGSLWDLWWQDRWKRTDLKGRIARFTITGTQRHGDGLTVGEKMGSWRSIRSERDRVWINYR